MRVRGTVATQNSNRDTAPRCALQAVGARAVRAVQVRRARGAPARPAACNAPTTSRHRVTAPSCTAARTTETRRTARRHEPGFVRQPLATRSRVVTRCAVFDGRIRIENAVSAPASRDERGEAGNKRLACTPQPVDRIIRCVAPHATRATPSLRRRAQERRAAIRKDRITADNHFACEK